MAKVHFIGAGPGDPELITVKGARLLREVDVIIFAGSLVDLRLVREYGPDAEVYDSSSMTLEETTSAIAEAILAGKSVARLHTGDPSIYGAIQEQMAELDRLGIDYDVVPGVTSAFAAAAALKQELTLPEVSQTVIFTRLEGKTPVPERESLKEIARIGATLVIYLSVSMIDRVVDELLQGAYTPKHRLQSSIGHPGRTNWSRGNPGEYCRTCERRGNRKAGSDHRRRCAEGAEGRAQGKIAPVRQGIQSRQPQRYNHLKLQPAEAR